MPLAMEKTLTHQLNGVALPLCSQTDFCNEYLPSEYHTMSTGSLNSDKTCLFSESSRIYSSYFA